MKKINPSEDTCENYRRGDVPDTVPKDERRCYSCFFNLFGRCWFQEAQREEFLVTRGLEGNEEAKLTIQRILESDNRA